jgi:hypothetical protein
MTRFLIHAKIKNRLKLGNACRLLPLKLFVSSSAVYNFAFWFCMHAKTWFLILRAEHRLRVNKNKLVRGIFGPKRYEIRGEWRKLHNEELHDLYSSSIVIRMTKPRSLRWGGNVARMG